MIVVDASAMFDVLMGEEAAIDRVDGQHMCCPYLLDAEIPSALRSEVLSRRIDAEVGRQMLARYARLELLRYEHLWLMTRVWELRDNLTSYDALYVALAEALGLPLVTTDVKMAAAPGVRASIEVLPVGA